MGRKKKKSSLNIFKIFFGSIKTYFLYLDKFVKYMMFPVFGQIGGLILIFVIAYLFNTNIEILQTKIPFMFSEKNFLIVYLCCLAPFFVILLKAFYEYLICFCALNSVCYVIKSKKKVQDIVFETHNEAIERRIFHYIVLLFLFFILSLILLIPVFWIFIPFFLLIFQIFALEQNSGPINSIKRSVELIKGHYFNTLILVLLVVLLTYFIIPFLMVWSFDYFKITSCLIIPVEKFIAAMPVDFYSINEMMQNSLISYEINGTVLAKMLVESVICSIFVMFTLPLRCCIFTELYTALDNYAIGKNANSNGHEETEKN